MTALLWWALAFDISGLPLFVLVVGGRGAERFAERHGWYYWLAILPPLCVAATGIALWLADHLCWCS